MGFKSGLTKGDGKDSGLCRILTGVSRWPLPVIKVLGSFAPDGRLLLRRVGATLSIA
jgi:hypothetical protein